MIAIASLIISLTCTHSANTMTSSEIIGSFVGVCATFMVGYQIWNTIDVKDTIKDAKQITEEFSNLKQKVEEGEKKIKENMDIANSLFSYNNHTNLMYVSDSVLFMHHAVLSGLDAKREDFDFVFDYLNLFISELTETSITGSRFFMTNSHNEKIINDRQSPYYGKLVSYAISDFVSHIKETDVIIKRHDDYSRIQLQYEQVMESLYEKIDNIRKGDATE
jgi:hypothetical protein